MQKQREKQGDWQEGEEKIRNNTIIYLQEGIVQTGIFLDRAEVVYEKFNRELINLKKGFHKW